MPDFNLLSSVTCVFFQDQNFFMPQIYLFLAKGLLFSSGTKGIPSAHAFHYCLNSFSADHDCISTCQQSPLRREIQFFLRRKIICILFLDAALIIWRSSIHPAGDSFSLMAFRYWYAHPSIYNFITQSREGTRGYMLPKVIYKILWKRHHVGCLVEQAGQEQEAQAWNQPVLDTLSIKLLSWTEPQSSCL